MKNYLLEEFKRVISGCIEHIKKVEAVIPGIVGQRGHKLTVVIVIVIMKVDPGGAGFNPAECLIGGNILGKGTGISLIIEIGYIHEASIGIQYNIAGKVINKPAWQLAVFRLISVLFRKV